MSELNFTMDNETKEIVSSMMEQAATRAVENYVKRQDEINSSKKDRRYQNTELLLRSYFKLKKHIEDSVDKETIELSDMFDIDIDDKDKIFLSSIFRTKRRTKVMMDHVDKCLENYKKICESNNKEPEIRKYKIIELLYLDKNKEASKDGWDNICISLHISRGTLNDTRRKAIQELSVLIFGIESLGIY